MGEKDKLDLINTSNWDKDSVIKYNEYMDSLLNEANSRESNLYSRIGILLSCELILLVLIVENTDKFTVDSLATNYFVAGFIMLFFSIFLQAILLIPFTRIVMPPISVKHLYFKMMAHEGKLDEIFANFKKQSFTTLNNKITRRSTAFGFSIILIIEALIVLSSCIFYELFDKCDDILCLTRIFGVPLFIVLSIANFNIIAKIQSIRKRRATKSSTSEEQLKIAVAIGMYKSHNTEKPSLSDPEAVKKYIDSFTSFKVENEELINEYVEELMFYSDSLEATSFKMENPTFLGTIVSLLTFWKRF